MKAPHPDVCQDHTLIDKAILVILYFNSPSVDALKVINGHSVACPQCVSSYSTKVSVDCYYVLLQKVINQYSTFESTSSKLNINHCQLKVNSVMPTYDHEHDKHLSLSICRSALGLSFHSFIICNLLTFCRVVGGLEAIPAHTGCWWGCHPGQVTVHRRADTQRRTTIHTRIHSYRQFRPFSVFQPSLSHGTFFTLKKSCCIPPTKNVT